MRPAPSKPTSYSMTKSWRLPVIEHVVVAVVAQLDRASGRARRQRCGAGGSAGWFPSRRTPRPCAGTRRRRGAPSTPSACGDLVLHLAGMLGRAVDEHVAVLLRHGISDLALEIELFLAADPESAFQPVRGGGEPRLPVAPLQRDRGNDKGLLRERVLDGEDRRQILVLDRVEPRGPACRANRLGDDQEDRLPDELHLGSGENGIVVEDRAEVVLARNVRRGEDRHDARRGAHGARDPST